MKLAVFLSFFSLSIFAVPAVSAPLKFGCTPLADLDSQSESCEDNAVYADAASACMDKLDAYIKNMTAATSAQLSHNASAAQKAQHGTLQGSQTGYNLSQANIDQILAAIASAKASTESYLDNIYFPEEWDAPPEVIGNDQEAYLDSQPCYAESRDILEDVSDDLDQYAEEFKAAKAAAAALEGASSQAKQGLGGQVGTTTPVPGAQPAAAGHSNIPQRPVPGASGVSGTEVLKKSK